MAPAVFIYVSAPAGSYLSCYIPEIILPTFGISINIHVKLTYPSVYSCMYSHRR